MSGVCTYGVSLSVMEGESVTVHTSVETNKQKRLDGILMTFSSPKSMEISIISVQMFSVKMLIRDSETD